MDYLAVAQMPGKWARSPFGVVFRRTTGLPLAWHAVSPDQAEPVALCGYRYARELHRTWNQTTVVRRCRRCQRLVHEAEHRQLLRGPLWASPWAPPEQEGAVVLQGTGRDGDATQGKEARERIGVAMAHRRETASGNAAAHGHLTVNGHVTTVGWAASNSHDGTLAAPPPVPVPVSDAPATPWEGRPIRRNGVLPSDVAHL